MSCRILPVASARGAATFYKTPAMLLDELGIREPEDIAIEAVPVLRRDDCLPAPSRRRSKDRGVR